MAKPGNRISSMTLDSGKTIAAHKQYKVAGWATVGSKAPGRPIWEVVAAYLRNKKVINIDKLNSPTLKNIANNPGISL
jgi:sulfur-oxidizing protein SoxB